jgi:Flp pilus assembly protein TadD
MAKWILHRRRRAVIATGLAVAFVLLAAVAGPSLLQRHRAQQAEKNFAAGEQAWARGAVREALLNFTTARSLQPHDPRPLLREGQLRLRTGDREGARALFRTALAPGSAYDRALVAVTYHDALMGAGWWSELATLALEMLPRRDELHLLWLQSASRP